MIWDRNGVAGGLSDAGRVLEELSAQAFHVAIVADACVEHVDPPLTARPCGPGAFYLCLNRGAEVYAVGPSGPQLLVRREPIALSGKADSARWVAGALATHGVAHADILVAGAEPGAGIPGAVSISAGGPEVLVAVLEDQIARRRRGEPPLVHAEPGWSVVVDGVDPGREQSDQTVLAISDGRIGTSGHPVLGHAGSAEPFVLAAGVYAGRGARSRLLGAPVWNRIAADAPPDSELRRVVDLRSGLASQEVVTADGCHTRTIFFSSLARPGTAVLRVEGPEATARPESMLRPASDRTSVERGGSGSSRWTSVPADPGGVAAAASERTLSSPHLRGLDRVAAYVADGARPPAASEAQSALVAVEEAGFERLLAEHRSAWAERWADADIVVEGDPQLQQGIRFSLFHLLAAAAETGEAAVGARGLTGHGYRGHVFWDTDIFVVPFLAATRPGAARAVLEYRVRRLDAARRHARASGRRGARFPWESARSGLDVTPKLGRGKNGETFPILTGPLEEHVVADVAWAACCYLDWTGDTEFADGPGGLLLAETARYWASRIEVDGARAGHIDHVIGPDEYHEDVADNAYTNVMARWNLRRAAVLADGLVPDDERADWLRLADAIVDGYDPETRLYEQFRGFNRLEPIVIADEHPVRPVQADLLYPRTVIQGAQIVKQTDVLMLHHLVPDEVAPGSLEPNLAFYEPRTAHHSSLSPAVHASLLARAGRLDEAVHLLRWSSRLDLDDLGGNTRDGLHIATMGGVWQALVFGFAGVRPAGEVLTIDPRLPTEWGALELRFRYRGTRVRVRIEPDAVELEAERPLRVALAGAAPARVHAPVRVPRSA